MSIRAVVFDRDGVLTYFDFAPFLDLLGGFPLPLGEARTRWEAWSARAGAPRSEAEEQELLRGFWDVLSDEYGLDADLRLRLHSFDYMRTIRPFADARPTLEALRRRGVRVGVLSNFPMASLGGSLRAVNLADLIDVTAAAPVIGAAKPAPAAYHHVLAALGVEPAETVLVDDEEPCVAGARAVGIDAYLLDRRDGLRPAEGARVLKNLGGVLERLD